MKRGRRILLFLLGCGVIGIISAWIESLDHSRNCRIKPKASMGFVPEAMGKESQPGQDPPAIVVAPNGVILKDGRPWRGIGINYFSAFNRLIVNGDDVSSFSGLEVLAKHKIPFIRFACCGFWPNDWNLYRTNKSEYFRRMDRLVTEARNRNIGLIPSLFWYDACISDVVMEPRNQLGNPSSKTIAFMVLLR
jgi:hypothetical protein